MKITPRFYKRKMPATVEGELKLLQVDGRLRMFVREDDSDDDYPSRICVDMDQFDLAKLIADLQYHHDLMRAAK